MKYECWEDDYTSNTSAHVVKSSLRYRIILFLLQTFSSGSSAAGKPKWMKDLEADDISMVQELGGLTPAQLLDKIRQLQNLAYQLGLEEGMMS